MKNLKKKKTHIKRVSECVNGEYINDCNCRQQSILSDEQLEDICNNTDLCDENYNEATVNVYDIEEMRSKLFKLLIQNEEDRQKRICLDNLIYIRDNEVNRLHSKLKNLDE